MGMEDKQISNYLILYLVFLIANYYKTYLGLRYMNFLKKKPLYNRMLFSNKEMNKNKLEKQG